MMRYLFIVLFMGLLGNSYAGSREVFNLNRDWKFFSDSETSSDGAATVNLPHIWSTDALSGKKDYFRGVGNYLKNIDIPERWRGKRVFIKFYGANSVADLIVNGRHVGEHHGGYTAFTFEITNQLNYGANNFFWVIVNNSPRLDVLPTAGDANVYGGLFRDVELVVTNDAIVSLTDYGSSGICVAPKKVSKDIVDAEALIRVNATTDKTVLAQLTVFTNGMDTVSNQSARVRLNGMNTSIVSIPFSINQPTLWQGVKNPYLYNVGVKIIQDNVVSDSLVIKTGFKFCWVDPVKGFMLNGEQYPLKGVVVNQDRASMGPAITPYQVKEDFNFIKDMGANAVRVSGLPHNSAFYSLCDLEGILVWSDMPLTGAAYRTDKAFMNTNAFKDNGKSQLREIIRQQYNHPSVMMWGIFSELTMRGDSPVDYVRELNSIAKSEDPSRLTVASSDQDGEINFITDLIVWNHSFGWQSGLPSDILVWLDQLNENWSNLRSGISYSGGASIYHQEDSLYRPNYMGNWHPERWQTYLHEEYYRNLKSDTTLWGKFVGNMFDYGAAGRNWGEGHGVNDCGLVTFDRKYRKDAFYFYKANWNSNDPFVYITERRWAWRHSTKQNIKIFTNQPEAELIVNGISHGTKSAEQGTILWNDIELNRDHNTIEARSGSLSDKADVIVINRGSVDSMN